jgi:membrane protein implicated in regulation of membrane protease activity
MTIAWWHWLTLGLLLIALEMRTHGGFYILVFGVTAMFISGLSLLDFAGPGWAQLLLFSVISITSLLVFRDPHKRRAKRERATMTPPEDFWP